MGFRFLPYKKAKKGVQIAGVDYDDSGGGGGGGDTSALANKTDLTAIILTGTTNTSGDTITAGTWFYLNGVLVKAKADIANGATFTENTNYEAKTVGDELTELNNNCIDISSDFFTISNSITYNALKIQAYKCGKIIQFFISMATTTSVSTYSTIGDINSKYTPVTECVGLNCQGYSTGQAGECIIQSGPGSTLKIYGKYTPTADGVIISGIYVMV